jgi:hypothetical protein
LAETIHIAAIASKVSNDLFDIFGWKKFGPTDQNWACANPEAHGAKTHPSDVVFYYDDPYRPERIYWNVDLKSYASGTISRPKISSAFRNLAKSVECANTSPGWSELYGDDEAHWRCDGLLFVYNHDNDYNGTNFYPLLNELERSQTKMAARRRLAVLGPSEINYLATVANDIRTQTFRRRLSPDPRPTTFWYPHLVRHKNVMSQEHNAASIEMLTGPWLTVCIPPQFNNGKREYIIYYRNNGSTIDEFKYLLDSLFRFQILTADSKTSIAIQLYEPADSALKNFERAKESLSDEMYGLAGPQLGAIACEPVTNIIRQFSPITLGWGDE